MSEAINFTNGALAIKGNVQHGFILSIIIIIIAVLGALFVISSGSSSHTYPPEPLANG